MTGPAHSLPAGAAFPADGVSSDAGALILLVVPLFGFLQSLS